MLTTSVNKDLIPPSFSNVKISLPIVLIIFLFLSAFSFAQSDIATPSDLRTEYLHNPLGMDVSHPRFSWVIESSERDWKQSAYQVEVSDNKQELINGTADMWNTQKVSSDTSINISYSGKVLKSNQSYYWKVRLWDENGKLTSWSEINFFHTGLFNQTDWGGEWIGAKDTTISSPLLREKFEITKNIKNAYVFICGLGYYELYLNGQKIGNHILDPGTTDYNKRALYITYNVKDYLQHGVNAVGVWLGNGYFRTFDKSFRHYGSRPQLIFQMNIEYEDGSSTQIVSNQSWKTSASPITSNSVYNGEIYDARLEKEGWDLPSYDDTKWENAIKINTPKGRILSAQMVPPIRAEKTLYPISMSEPINDIYVFDFGQNFSGIPILHVDGGEGEEVQIKTAEVTRRDMIQMQGGDTKDVVDTIDASEDRSAKARDIYILSGKSGMEIYSPKFTQHGFRYVQLEGFPGKPNLTSLTASFVHSDITPAGEFDCSNSLFNKIHQNVLWGQQSDLMSMPTDCNQRDERMGWMADADLSAEEAIHNFDMAAFYTNWLMDIQDEQQEDGSVPDIAPDHKWLYETRSGTPAWQAAYPLIVWYVHEYYGDNRILKEHYQSLKKWMDYMKSISNNYIISSGRGDWVSPERGGTPGDGSIPITSTGYYYKSAEIMMKIADILNKKNDEVYFATLARNIKNSFNQHLWNSSKGYYGSGSQTSDAFPLYVGIVPEGHQQEVIKNLIDNIMIKHNGHLWTGILGTKALIETLPRYNRTDVLNDIVDQTTYPGWGYMVSQGATTLWERWGGYRYFNASMNSLNHIMFGSVDEFFYKDLAGIRMEEPGYKKILIKPYISDVSFVNCSINTIRGIVSSKWSKMGNELTFNELIPANSEATIEIPKSDLKAPFTLMENGNLIWASNKFENNSEGIQDVKEFNDYFQVSVGSGKYSFELRGQ
jgi:alpha-L-rhamnosidase